MVVVLFFQILLSLLAAYCQYADALIGLRPPKKTPPKDKKNDKQTKPPTSPRPTQLHSPYANPSLVHNITNIVNSEDLNKHDTPHITHCHTMPLLRCSYKLLSQSLQNESICRQVQQFSKCSKSSLRESGRRDFSVGVGIVENFRRTIYNKHSCHVNTSSLIPEHQRHHRAKRQGSQCCVDGILNCAVEVFLKMTYDRQQRCPLVDFYQLCLEEANDSCQLDTLRTLYPVFTMQLKRKCKTARLRHR